MTQCLSEYDKEVEIYSKRKQKLMEDFKYGNDNIAL